MTPSFQPYYADDDTRLSAFIKDVEVAEVCTDMDQDVINALTEGGVLLDELPPPIVQEPPAKRGRTQRGRGRGSASGRGRGRGRRRRGQM